jgi:hypothetical protein
LFASNSYVEAIEINAEFEMFFFQNHTLCQNRGGLADFKKILGTSGLHG